MVTEALKDLKESRGNKESLDIEVSEVKKAPKDAMVREDMMEKKVKEDLRDAEVSKVKPDLTER